MIRKVIQPFYTAFVLLTFVVSILAAFPFFLLIGSRDHPNSREAIWHIVHYWAIGWLALIGMPIRRIGKKPDNGRYVVVANHISYMDTIAIYAALPCYFRTLAKKEMARIPLFGFVYKQLTILVDRSSPEHRTKSMRLMWRAIRNESNIAIFPEGTFNETAEPMAPLHNGAFKLAITSQTPILPVLFLDTVKRWHYSGWWKLWPGRNRVLFLDPVPVEGLSVADLPALKQQIQDLMGTELKKYGYPYIYDVKNASASA
jgi:1-acyl-sn-glycerol-3-phosphate acyltransferase